jgi:2-polyprenyl-6-methoxyphenol hydroxylase-like FAD-dependent oxidoreductase
MRKVAIIGGGQSGLQLALGLLHIELTDNNGILAGRFPPVVRQPICKLPSGGLVLGIGDVVATNDPITGQGANTGSRAASIYLQRILEHGNKPFDAQWMLQTFDLFWDYAQWVVKWTNSLLVPPTPQILRRTTLPGGLTRRRPVT